MAEEAAVPRSGSPSRPGTGPLTDAERRLVESNLGLVYWMACRYAPWAGRVGLSVDDLVSEGTFALADAVRGHDPARGELATLFRFHGRRRLRQACKRAGAWVGRTTS